MELNNIEVGENMQINWHSIERLMESKEWPDALMLWFRYYRQRLIQWQQLTYSTDKFMMNWTKWSKVRFYKAKNLLIKLWMIDVVQKRENNKITGWYVRVNYTFNPETVRTHSVIYEMEEKEQLEQLESLNWRIFEMKNLQNERQIQPNNKEIQPNNKIKITEEKFEDFWRLYPKKRKKSEARKKFMRIKDEEIEKIMSWLNRYLEYWRRKGTEMQYIPDPTTWINQERRNDELETQQIAKRPIYQQIDINNLSLNDL